MTPAEVTVYSDGRERARTDEAMQQARSLAHVVIAIGGGNPDAPIEERFASIEASMVPATAHVRKRHMAALKKMRHGMQSIAALVERAMGGDK